MSVFEKMETTVVEPGGVVFKSDKVPTGTNVDIDITVTFKKKGEYHVSVSEKGIIVTKEG